MNDNSLKREATVGRQDEPDTQKKCRGTFFGAEVESVVASFKQQLFAQINDSVVKAKAENSEILKRLDEEESFNNAELSSKEGRNELSDYAEKIQSLSKISGILKRAKPFCDFVESNILLPSRKALEKIRTACGCDLNNHETWGIANPHTAKICELAVTLESAKYELSTKCDDFYDQMQLFILIYQDAKEEHKADFFSKLNAHPLRMAWIQPWLNIAEGKEVSFEGALLESQKVLPEQQSFIPSEITVGM